MVGLQRRARTRKILAWGAGVSGLICVALAGVVATAPRWGAPRLERELEQRLSARLDARVEIGSLDASWSGATVRDLSVTVDGDEPLATIDLLRLDVASGPLWRARIEVETLAAEGGELGGTRAAIETLAKRVLELRGEGAQEEGRSWLRRRIRLTPETLELEGLELEIVDGGRSLEGLLSMTVAPAREQVELRVEALVAELGLGRPLRASSVRTALSREQGQLSFPIELEVDGVAAKIDEHIAVAGVHGSVVVEDALASMVGVELSGGFAELSAAEAQAGSEDLWSISGAFARDLSRGKVAVEMAAFELGRVPEVLARLPVVDSESATIGGELEIAFGDGVAQLDGALTLAGLNVSHRLLAREVVRDVGFSVELDAQVDPRARAVKLERLEVSRGGVELRVRGELIHAREREQRRYQLALEVPAVACQAVLEAIPRELVPGLVGFELDGAFAADVKLDADFAKLDDLVLDAEIGLEGCTVKGTPRLASAARLNNGFVHRVTMRDGRTRRVPLYSGSSSYTPLDGISRYMTEAVLTTEDGTFRRHDGFNRTQLGVALRRNLKSGKVRIGASTITMQMVKNVLLSHERTLSRKLQELFLTWWVEQALSKQRIMELYLNVIEFGPGVYGVSNASRHYFGKHPAELGSLEAAYLAAMLPSPVRRHVHYCNGELSERFERKVHWVHGLMLERGRITQAEHEVYAVLGLDFDLLERSSPEQCHAEISTLMAGDHAQRALSGLLGDGDSSEELLERGGSAHSPSRSWGVRPELPWIDAEAMGELGSGASDEPGARLEPDEDTSWRVPTAPVGEDPAMADAPGVPAMDE